MHYVDVAKIIVKGLDSNPDLSVMRLTCFVTGPESALFKVNASDGTHYTITVNQSTLDNSTNPEYLEAIKNDKPFGEIQ